MNSWWGASIFGEHQSFVRFTSRNATRFSWWKSKKNPFLVTAERESNYYNNHCKIYPKKESEVAQLWPTLWDPMDCSLSGSSVHGILQVRILEWVAISSSRGSSEPRDRTRVSCIAGGRFIVCHQGSPIITILRYTQSILHNKAHLSRRKDFTWF